MIKTSQKFSNEEVFVEREIPYFFFKTLSKKNRVKVVNDICNELKSVKNIIEINNSRKAHLYDGIALVKFFFIGWKKTLIKIFLNLRLQKN